MKIGIIAFGFIPGGTGGTETYFRTLLKGLQKYDVRNDYTLIVNKKYLRDAEILVTAKNWRVIGIRDIPSMTTRILRKLRIIDENNESIIEKKINKMHLEVVHFPFQVLYPYELEAKKILTFHDMQEKHYPEFFSRQELTFRKNNFKKSVIKAQAVIAISKYTASDIKKYYGPKAYDKTKVIYTSKSSFEKKIHKNNRFDKYTPYFYYPAATWPHKNHERLIRSFKLVSKKYPEYKLVLTGLSRQKSGDINNLIKRLGLENNVINLGYLSYEELPNVFLNAYAMVFPSLFEGLGIPLLEAMHYRLPIASSDSSSLPEVGGKAAIYFNPFNTKDIADKITQLIENKKLCKRLIKASVSQLKKFSLEKMTLDTIDVYNKVIDEK